MSIHGPISVPLQPNWPSSHGELPTNGGNSHLAKKVLENQPTPSSPLETKKVSKTDSLKKPESPNTYFSPKLPYFPPNSKPLQTIITKVVTARKRCWSEIEEKPLDMNPRTLYTLHSLALARICHQTKQLEEEGKLIDSVKTAVDSFLLSKYFHSGSHFAKYLLDGYHGITCLDMNVIRDNLLSLRRAIALTPDNQKLSIELDQAAEFFAMRWKELKEEGQIDEEMYNLLNQNLKQVLTEDPFKDEFMKNPELFKKVKDAPEILLKKYPHLASVNDFLARYPDAGTIRLRDGTYNLQNLKLTLSDAEASPLTQSINLLVEEPVITSTAAKLIKDFMLKNPKVQVYLSDEADGSELAKAFLEDKTLVNGKGALMFAKGVVTGRSEPVYCYKIDPQDPFIRK